jgi:drug/metabolite transporter (DMT)-like permease
MLIYLLLGWLASVLYRSGAKINKINPIYSIVIIWWWLLIIWITLMLYNNIKFTNIFSSFSEISGILILSVWSVLGTLIIMYAMQDNIPMASFLPLYQIFSLIMVTLVGILVFREKINLYQSIWIILSLISIWLIMKK